MDIPDNTPRIRNLHPSQMIFPQSYGSIPESSTIPITRTRSSISERISEFAGSYSRASMTFMAENLTVPVSNISTLVIAVQYIPLSHSFIYVQLDEEDKYSFHSSNNIIITRIGSSSGSEYLVDLDKVVSSRSIATVADEYISPVIIKKSSYTQSIFNSINILLGVGILALPLGFKCAGWIIGMTVFLFCCGLTNYTAKLLQKCLDIDPESRTYGDMGALAFGFKGRLWVTALFITELITNR